MVGPKSGKKSTINDINQYIYIYVYIYIYNVGARFIVHDMLGSLSEQIPQVSLFDQLRRRTYFFGDQKSVVNCCISGSSVHCTA
jgi:hypothetical protein